MRKTSLRSRVGTGCRGRGVDDKRVSAMVTTEQEHHFNLIYHRRSCDSPLFQENKQKQTKPGKKAPWPGRVRGPRGGIRLLAQHLKASDQQKNTLGNNTTTVDTRDPPGLGGAAVGGDVQLVTLPPPYGTPQLAETDGRTDESALERRGDSPSVLLTASTRMLYSWILSL